ADAIPVELRAYFLIERDHHRHRRLRNDLPVEPATKGKVIEPRLRWSHERRTAERAGWFYGHRVVDRDPLVGERRRITAHLERKFDSLARQREAEPDSTTRSERVERRVGGERQLGERPCRRGVRRPIELDDAEGRDARDDERRPGRPAAANDASVLGAQRHARPCAWVGRR